MRDFLIAVFVFLIFLFGVKTGENQKQRDIKNRAKKIETETITQQQLEIIIFGETQE